MKVTCKGVFPAITTQFREDQSLDLAVTAAGMGHIVFMDDSPAQIAITRYSRTLWTELAGELPADVEYMACGSIWVAADEEEMAEAGRKKRLYDEIEVPSEVLSPEALAEAEPHRRFSSWREAKLQTRCGMGPCQGRVCGGAVEFLLGWKPAFVRPPVFPARIESLTRVAEITAANTGD